MNRFIFRWKLSSFYIFIDRVGDFFFENFLKERMKI
jgi:hypothetical protein